MSAIQPSAPPLARPLPRTRSRLALSIAVLVALLVVIGFARTFYLRPLYFDTALPLLAIVHGLVMSAWLLLFVAQAWLVQAHRVKLHRRLGLSSVVMVPLVVGLGLAMAVHGMRAGHIPVPGITPQQFLAIPFCNIIIFGVLATSGLLARRRSEVHRRLMLLAALVLLSPAVARMPVDAIKLYGPPLIFGVTGLLVLAVVVRDTVVHRRLHPAFGWGGALAVFGMPMALVLSQTPGWTAFADLLM
ncbi:MAG TPA: hypothetical protein VFG73_09570 [Rhodanobacteraceae bacterium]|nr:hypothetical protein [Rhodanobacteraceae bacterium]